MEVLKMSNEYKLPQYSTKLFTEIWETAAEFLADYQSAGIPTTISTANATTLYYLLYAKYGNNPIANRDISQFKYKVLSIIFEYGPTWEKRLAIQQSLRSLSEDELLRGAKAIYNQALNAMSGDSVGSYYDAIKSILQTAMAGINGTNAQSLMDQIVTINADFPNVESAAEIKAALIAADAVSERIRVPLPGNRSGSVAYE